jgi:hypothetical protein
MAGPSDPVGSAQALFAELRRRGLVRVYGAVHAKVSVLSLPGGVTVWCRGGALTWRGRDGREVVWAAGDAVGAASLLLAEVASAEVEVGLAVAA